MTHVERWARNCHERGYFCYPETGKDNIYQRKSFYRWCAEDVETPTKWTRFVPESTLYDAFIIESGSPSIPMEAFQATLGEAFYSLYGKNLKRVEHMMVKRYSMTADHSVLPPTLGWYEESGHFENHPCIEFPEIINQANNGMLHRVASIGAESFRLELTMSRANADQSNSLYGQLSAGSFDIEAIAENPQIIPSRKRMWQEDENAQDGYFGHAQEDDSPVDEDEQDHIAQLADEASKRQRLKAGQWIDGEAVHSEAEESCSLNFSELSQ
jgi:hypothetical protein